MVTQDKWRIFKESSIAPQLGPPKWVVWSPEYEETIFNSHADAIAYINRCANPSPLGYLKTYYKIAKKHLANLKETT